MYVSIHQNCPEPSPNHLENVQNIDIMSFLEAFMTVAALHTNDIFQYLELDKIVITFTAKQIPYSVCVISTWISVINMRICNVLLNFFVSVYILEFKFDHDIRQRKCNRYYETPCIIWIYRFIFLQKLFWNHLFYDASLFSNYVFRRHPRKDKSRVLSCLCQFSIPVPVHSQ